MTPLWSKGAECNKLVIKEYENKIDWVNIDLKDCLESN